MLRISYCLISYLSRSLHFVNSSQFPPDSGRHLFSFVTSLFTLRTHWSVLSHPPVDSSHIFFYWLVFYLQTNSSVQLIPNHLTVSPLIPDRRRRNTANHLELIRIQLVFRLRLGFRVSVRSYNGKSCMSSKKSLSGLQIGCEYTFVVMFWFGQKYVCQGRPHC